MKMEAITTTTSSSSSNTSSPAATNIHMKTGGHEEHNSSQPLSAAPSASSSPGLSPSGKIWGRNINGTSVLTSAPNNEAELQLYRVLQRASLLAYYDTLLEMGGDDVQQLCDAGEEEFLEIMALVGMATKPLHVRRLQKSLHEWVTNPALFQAPLAPPMNYVSFPETSPQMSSYSPEPSTSKKCPNLPIFTPTPLITAAIAPAQQFTPHTTPTTHHHHHPTHHHHVQHQVLPAAHQVTSSSPQLTPILTEAQVRKIIQGIEKVGAEKIATEIAKHEPRTQNIKKRTTRELEGVMAMSEQDPRRMDEIRKHSAIYGRYDCKRRPDKPLTLHEVCVNEAAAQLCKLIPALLTRRDHLFTLARQIVKDCGFGQSASVAKFSMATSVITTPSITASQRQTPDDHDTVVVSVKRQRLSSTETADSGKENVEDTRFNFFAMYQRFARPQEDGSRNSTTNRSDFEDNENDDSRFSFSNSSNSPLPQLNGSDIDQNGKDDSNSSTTLHVLSAAGGHIIAVANPALALSPALNDTVPMKRETNTTP